MYYSIGTNMRYNTSILSSVVTGGWIPINIAKHFQCSSSKLVKRQLMHSVYLGSCSSLSWTVSSLSVILFNLHFLLIIYLIIFYKICYFNGICHIFILTSKMQMRFFFFRFYSEWYIIFFFCSSVYHYKAFVVLWSNTF